MKFVPRIDYLRLYDVTHTAPVKPHTAATWVNFGLRARTSLECPASTLLYSYPVYYTVSLTLNRYLSDVI